MPDKTPIEIWEKEIGPYRNIIQNCLGTPMFSAIDRSFGYTIIRRDALQLPKYVDGIKIDDMELDLKDRHFLDFVLIIKSSIGIRSHDEEYQEIVKNIGSTPIIYKSVDEEGFYHGFSVEKVGLLYVAKALLPGFTDGNPFRMPENTYSPDMPEEPKSIVLNPDDSKYSVNRKS